MFSIEDLERVRATYKRVLFIKIDVSENPYGGAKAV